MLIGGRLDVNAQVAVICNSLHWIPSAYSYSRMPLGKSPCLSRLALLHNFDDRFCVVSRQLVVRCIWGCVRSENHAETPGEYRVVARNVSSWIKQELLPSSTTKDFLHSAKHHPVSTAETSAVCPSNVCDS